MAKVKNRKDTAAPSERMTATDTLNLNPAFISRVKKEEGTQQSAMAEKLRQDMDRMKEEQLFADMQFMCGSQSIPGHRVIIKSRLKNDGDDSWYETLSSGDLPALPLCAAAVGDIKEFMKVLYTSGDVDAKFVMDALKKQNKAAVDTVEVESVCLSTSSEHETEHEKNLSDNDLPSSQPHTAPDEDLQPGESDVPTESDKNNVTVQNISTKTGVSIKTEAAVVAVPTDNHDGEHFQSSSFQNGPSSQVNGHDTEHHDAGINGDSVEEKLPVLTVSDCEKVGDSTQAEATKEEATVHDSISRATEEEASVHDSISDHITANSVSDNEQGDHEESCPEEPLSEQNVEEEGISQSYTEADTESTKTSAASAVTASTSHTLPEESDSLSNTPEGSIKSSSSLAQPQNGNGASSSEELSKDTSEPAAAPSPFAGDQEDLSRKGGGGDAMPSEISYIPCSSLAADLLQCYVQQGYTDCCLKVEGHKFLAHRCILSARCQYFEAMFAGSWSESREAEIELHGVGARAVKYMLLFLYGAMLEVPASDIQSLIQASDMFGVEGLKDWLGFLLSRDFCHFFHKPCQDCIRMVADVLVLASQFNLTSLAERGKRWVATHFRRIWEMPNFGTLPPDLLEECTKAVIDQMNLQNITQVILDSHLLVQCLQQNHRAHPMQVVAVRVMDEALAFCAAHFPQLVRSPRFLSWSKDGAWCMDVLGESYTMAVSLLQPEVACDVYSTLRQLLADSEREDGGGQYTSEEVQCLLKKLVERCEWYLHRYIHRVVHCPQWSALPAELQQQLLQKCSFVPAHAASFTGAKSRVGQKSAKSLQDNIVHTVTMLCETDPDLFPSLAQTRKILTDSSKQPPPKQKPPARTTENQHKAGGRPETIAKKPQKETSATVRQSEALKSKSKAGSSSSSLSLSASRPGSGKSQGGASASVSQASTGQKTSGSCPASATSQGKGPSASSVPKATQRSNARPSPQSGSHSESASSAASQGKGASASSVTKSAPGLKATASSQAGSRPNSASASSVARTAPRLKTTASAQPRPQSASASSAVTKTVQELKGASSSPSDSRPNSASTSTSKSAVNSGKSPSSVSRNMKTAGAGRQAESQSVVTKSSASGRERQKESQSMSTGPSSSPSTRGTSSQISAQTLKQKSSVGSSKQTTSSTVGSRQVGENVSAQKGGLGSQTETSRTTQKTKAANNLKTTKLPMVTTGAAAKPPSTGLPKGGSQPASGQSSSSRSTLRAAHSTTMKTPQQASHLGKSSPKPHQQTSSPSMRKPVGSSASETDENTQSSSSQLSSENASLTKDAERYAADSESVAAPAFKTSDSGNSEVEGTSTDGNLDFNETQTATSENKDTELVLLDTKSSPESQPDETTQESNESEIMVSASITEAEVQNILNAAQTIPTGNNVSLFTENAQSQTTLSENSESTLATDSSKVEDNSQAHQDIITGASELPETVTSADALPLLGTNVLTEKDDTQSVEKKDSDSASSTAAGLVLSHFGEHADIQKSLHDKDNEKMQVFDQDQKRTQDMHDEDKENVDDFCDEVEASHHKENTKREQDFHGENKETAVNHPHEDKDMAQEVQEENTEVTKHFQDKEMAQDVPDREIAQPFGDTEMAQNLQDEAMAQGFQDDAVAQDLQDTEVANKLQDEEDGQDLQDEEDGQDLQDKENGQDLHVKEMAQGLHVKEAAQNLQDIEMAQDQQD